MSGVLNYSRFLGQLCAPYIRIYKPSPEEFRQPRYIGEPVSLEEPLIRQPLSNGDFMVMFNPSPSPGPSTSNSNSASDQGHGQPSPNLNTSTSTSSLSAVAEPFVPSAEDQAMVENLCRSPSPPPAIPWPTLNAPTNPWVRLYSDPYHFRFGAGQLTTVPAYTIPLPGPIPPHASQVVPTLQHILSKYDLAVTTITFCGRQSFHLGEETPIPTALIKYSHANSGNGREEVLCALEEIKDYMWYHRGMAFAIEIVDVVFDEWLGNVLGVAEELDSRSWEINGCSLALGKNQEDILDGLYPVGGYDRQRVFEAIGRVEGGGDGDWDGHGGGWGYG
ncbi:hypothetical protein BDW74DRAFT_183984 [Aspergillus multicolor]|uniref:uncharacterized protein n=1 Tax=Aspergillus multicolor TaxID=41759 RepID=UPI003CCD1582